MEMKEPVPVAPTPQPQRRPRVREVSSRFMSPVVSPAPSTSDHHHHQCLPTRAKSPLHKPIPPTPTERHRRSNSVQRQRSSDPENDENRSEVNFRSSESLPATTSRVALRLFKERGTGEIQRRGDTPTVTSTLLRSRRANSCNLASAAESAAAKLLHSTGLSNGGSRGCGGGSYRREPSPKSSPVKSSAESVSSDESDNSVKGGDCLRPGASPLTRSLTLPVSGGNDRSIFESIRASDKSASLNLKGLNGAKGGGMCLPPMPPPPASSKAAPIDGKKGKKDDVYRLKMLQNHYLQWRLANAKAEASMAAQKRESETMLYSLGVKLSDLRDSVQRKREEVKRLQRERTLALILEAQMPYLDVWSNMEEDYSSALTDTTQCLLNVSSQLPLAGNAKVDVGELSEALNSAVKTMDSIFGQVHSFMPQAEEVGSLASQMAGVFSGEQAMIQECKDLLSRSNALQVGECYLRSQLMQLHQLNGGVCSKQNQELQPSLIQP